jgi:arylsulfatase A-like enzyme
MEAERLDYRHLSRGEFLRLLLLSAIAGSGIPAGLTQLVKAGAPSKSSSGPNFLIVVFDALTAANIALYGYERETTPNLAKFAEQATVYHQHYSGGNFTVPGTASTLTGVLPWTHHGLHLFGTVSEEFTDRNLFAVLKDAYYIAAYTQNSLVMGLFNQFQKHIDQLTPPRDLAILSEQTADHLFDRDYWIALWGERIVRGSGLKTPGSLFLSYTSLGEDFDPYTPKLLMEEYGSQFPEGLPNHSMGIFFMLEKAIDWIREQANKLPQPYLGYFHLLPPHEPYNPRTDFINLFKDDWQPLPKPRLFYSQNWSESYLAGKRVDYDRYIAYVDEEFGRLVEGLKQDGALENTYLILTSDHGQLYERGIHGHLTRTLYEPVIRVPLIIAKPGQKERQDVFTPTSSIDMMPTLLQAAGKPVPSWIEGRILPGFEGWQSDPERSLFVIEAKNNPKYGPIETGTAAIIKGGYKLVRYFGYTSKDGYELYHLDTDPEERVNLYQEGTIGVGEALKTELNAQLDEKNVSWDRVAN